MGTIKNLCGIYKWLTSSLNKVELVEHILNLKKKIKNDFRTEIEECNGNRKEIISKY